MTDTIHFMAAHKRHHEALVKANDLNKTVVFDALDSLNITTINVNFNGEDDSVQIKEVVAYKGTEATKMPATSVDINHIGMGNDDASISPCTLQEAIETLCYDHLTLELVGWENNDDAYGDFTFHVKERRIEMEII